VLESGVNNADLGVYTYDQRVTHRVVKLQSNRMVDIDPKSMTVTLKPTSILPVSFDIKLGSD